MSGLVGYLNTPVRIVAGADAPGAKEWKFDNSGNIVLPQGGNILTSTGISVLGELQTGNIIFDNNTIGNANSNTDINIETTSLTFGNQTWNFDPAGKLTLPNNGQVVQNFAITSTTTVDITDPLSPTLIWTSDSTFTSTAKLLIMLEQDTISPTTFTVTNNGTGNYVINSVLVNPLLRLVRGQTYTFNVNAPGHPFWIKTALTTGDTTDIYNNGLGNNGTDNGTITFFVPFDAPDTLYYVCQFHPTMQGTLSITSDRFITQSCEAMIAAKGADGLGLDAPAISVYGITYTNASALATFSATRNITSDKIEVFATLNETTNLAYLRIHSIELLSRN